MKKAWLGWLAAGIFVSGPAQATQLITAEEAKVPPPKGAITMDRRVIFRSPKAVSRWCEGRSNNGNGGECQSIPSKDEAFPTFLAQNPPFELPPENGIPAFLESRSKDRIRTHRCSCV